MTRRSFAVARERPCKRCGADEWLRRRDKSVKRGFSYACAPCERKRLRTLRADPAFTLLHSARARAKKRRVPCTIAIEDVRAVFPADFRCPVLGTALQFGRRVATAASPTLDRIDPVLGYVPGNIAVISKRANIIKSDATLNELEQVVQWLRGHKPGGLGEARANG
jgi:hypothetical protein